MINKISPYLPLKLSTGIIQKTTVCIDYLVVVLPSVALYIVNGGAVV